jgi:hypothetical protein
MKDMLHSTNHHRALSGVTAALAALAFASAPALAGENDEDGDDQASAPAQTAPAATPQGGVATGFGGTAPSGGNTGLVVALATGALMGGLAALRRRPS